MRCACCAEEGASFEQNPPSLVEFIRRDLRWCQGNMQYWHFLPMPGLHPVSRYQLAFAILMFLGSPAWIGLLLIGSAAVAAAPTWQRIHPGGCRTGDLHRRAGDVVCAQGGDRHRRSRATRAAAQFRRRNTVHRRRAHRGGIFSAARADHVGEPYAVSRRHGVRTFDRLGRRRRATITKCRGRWQPGSSGHTPCSDWRPSCCWPRPSHGRFPLRCSSPVVRCCRSRSRWRPPRRSPRAR